MDAQVGQKRPSPTDFPQKLARRRRCCSVVSMSRYTCDILCKCRDLKEPCNTACTNRLEHKLCTARNCSYSSECSNSASNLTANVVRKRSLLVGAGDGLFAARDVAPGNLLIEYVGCRLSAEAVDQQRMMARWQLGEHGTHYLYRLPDGSAIDGNPMRKQIGRPSTKNVTTADIGAGLINFSHETNCAYVNLMDDDQHGLVRVFAYATKPIDAGEELYSDYGTEFPMEGLDPVPCACNTPSCSKWIGVGRAKSSASTSRNNSPGIAADASSCSPFNVAPSSVSCYRRWSPCSGTNETFTVCRGSRSPQRIKKRGGRPSAQMVVFSTTPHKICDLKLFDAGTLTLVFVDGRADGCHPSACKRLRDNDDDDDVDSFPPTPPPLLNQESNREDSSDEIVWLPAKHHSDGDDQYIPAGSASAFVVPHETEKESRSSESAPASLLAAPALFSTQLTASSASSNRLSPSFVRPLSQPSLSGNTGSGELHIPLIMPPPVSRLRAAPQTPRMDKPTVQTKQIPTNEAPAVSTSHGKAASSSAAPQCSTTSNSKQQSTTNKAHEAVLPAEYCEEEDDIMFWSCGKLMLQAIFDD